MQSAAMWEWRDRAFDILRREWPVVKRAPVLFGSAVLLASLVPFFGFRWYYSDLLERIAAEGVAKAVNGRLAVEISQPVVPNFPRLSIKNLAAEPIRYSVERLTTHVDDVLVDSRQDRRETALPPGSRVELAMGRPLHQSRAAKTSFLISATIVYGPRTRPRANVLHTIWGCDLRTRPQASCKSILRLDEPIASR